MLAAAMMFQMLPLMVFADDGAASSDVKIEGKEGTYTSLKEAVEKAESGDTILLGEGNYTLYGIPSDTTTKGKNLTFVGEGTDKTFWNIGAEVPDPKNYGTEYNSDYSFKGAGTITFCNMTLRSGTANYLGFTYADNTVVDGCEINGLTFYWGYQSATFKDTVFNAPSSNYAIWTYSSPVMTFDSCTFNTSGKAVNVYTDYGAGKNDIVVNFKDCTVNNCSSKQALNINDSNMGAYQYIIHISGSNNVTAARESMTCSQVYGFGGKTEKNTGRTTVEVDGVTVWKGGELQTHEHSDGEKDNAYTINSVSDWTETGDHFEREVNKTCKYCGYQKEETEKGYQLSYVLNGGTGAEGADYESKIYPEGEKAAAVAAPALEGFRFTGWQDSAGSQYAAGAEITPKANMVLTAQWESTDVPEPDPEPGDDGSGAVIGVVIGGAAVIGGYELATRLYLKHLIGVVPSTRGELALLMWEHADKPEPKTAFTYSDIDEDDTDLQKAAQWCVENEYLHVRDNDNDRFHPNGWVPKLKVIQAWDKAFGLQAKANADK